MVFFGDIFLTTADLVLFLITAVLILGSLALSVYFISSNLRLARITRNRRAYQVSLAAPALLLILSIIFHLSPGSRWNSYVLLGLCVGLLYIEQNVNRQLHRQRDRRHRQRRSKR